MNLSRFFFSLLCTSWYITDFFVNIIFNYPSANFLCRIVKYLNSPLLTLYLSLIIDNSLWLFPSIFNLISACCCFAFLICPNQSYKWPTSIIDSYRWLLPSIFNIVLLRLCSLYVSQFILQMTDIYHRWLPLASAFYI